MGNFFTCLSVVPWYFATGYWDFMTELSVVVITSAPFQNKIAKNLRNGHFASISSELGGHGLDGQRCPFPRTWSWENWNRWMGTACNQCPSNSDFELSKDEWSKWTDKNERTNRVIVDGTFKFNNARSKWRENSVFKTLFLFERSTSPGPSTFKRTLLTCGKKC